MAGRPPFIPSTEDRRVVEALASVGTQQEKIAEMILDGRGRPINVKTLVKHFKRELSVGKIKTIAAIAQNIFRIANGPASGPTVDAAKFVLTMQGGWKRPPVETQFLGKDGEPTDVPGVVLYLPDNGRD